VCAKIEERARKKTSKKKERRRDEGSPKEPHSFFTKQEWGVYIFILHSVGSNKIARIPHVSRMWHEAILSLFRDISREVPVDLTVAVDPVPVDLTAAADATVGLSFDTYDGGPPEMNEEDVECEVIDGGTHPGVVGG